MLEFEENCFKRFLFFIQPKCLPGSPARGLPGFPLEPQRTDPFPCPHSSPSDIWWQELLALTDLPCSGLNIASLFSVTCSWHLPPSVSLFLALFYSTELKKLFLLLWLGFFFFFCRPPTAHSGLRVSGCGWSDWRGKEQLDSDVQREAGDRERTLHSQLRGAGGWRCSHLAGWGWSAFNARAANQAERDRLTEFTGAWWGSQTTNVLNHEGRSTAKQPGNFYISLSAYSSPLQQSPHGKPGSS